MLAEKYHVTQNVIKDVKDDIDTLASSEEIQGFVQKLKRLRGDYSDQTTYMEQIMYIISGFTNDYKKVSGL